MSNTLNALPRTTSISTSLPNRREPFAKIVLFCCEALQRAAMPALPPWLDPPCRQPQDEPGAELVAKMRRCGISGDRYRNPPDREHFLDERFIGRKVRDAFVPGSRYTRPLIRPGLNRISVERVLIGSGAAPRTEARATQREAVRLELWTGASKLDRFFWQAKRPC